VRGAQGLTFEPAYASVKGLVRESYFEVDRQQESIYFPFQYCADGPDRDEAMLDVPRADGSASGAVSTVGLAVLR